MRADCDTVAHASYGQLTHSATHVHVNFEIAEAAQSELRRIKSDVATAKQHVSDMEMANRSIPEPTRRDLGNKIRRYKDTLAEVQKDLGSAEAKFSRSALMGGAGGRDRPLDFDRST